MPVVAHPKLPSLDRPELKEILEVDDLDNANPPRHELHVALLNLMPDAALQATERQFIRLLGSNNEFLVHVEFVVDDFGVIHKIKVQGKHDPSIIREVKRMIQSMPKWIPGEVNGRSVSTRMYLPIRIDLQ